MLPDDLGSIITISVRGSFLDADHPRHGVNFACLFTRLRAEGVNNVVICGLTTPHCVSTTTRMAANLGFSATVVHDACAAFASNSDTAFDKGPKLTPNESHRAALAHLNGEFARVVATDDVVAL